MMFRFYILFLVSSLTLHAFPESFRSAATRRLMFVGTIQFPDTVKNPQPFNLSFKGQPILVTIDGERGYYELYDQCSLDEFYIIVTEQVKQPCNCDITHWETLPQSKYRYFKVKRKFKATGSERVASLNYQEYWSVQELDNTRSLRLPDNTLIIYLNPDLIENVQEVSWSVHDNVIKLPKIVFKDSIDPEQFHDEIARSAAAFMDMMPFHKKENKIMLVGNDRTLSLPMVAKQILS